MFLIWLPKLSKKRKMLLVQCLAMSCSSLHQHCPGKLTWCDGLSVCLRVSMGETADAKIKSLGVSRAISRSCTGLAQLLSGKSSVARALWRRAKLVLTLNLRVLDLCRTCARPRARPSCARPEHFRGCSFSQRSTAAARKKTWVPCSSVSMY